MNCCCYSYTWKKNVSKCREVVEAGLSLIDYFFNRLITFLTMRILIMSNLIMIDFLITLSSFYFIINLIRINSFVINVIIGIFRRPTSYCLKFVFITTKLINVIKNQYSYFPLENYTYIIYSFSQGNTKGLRCITV